MHRLADLARLGLPTHAKVLQQCSGEWRSSNSGVQSERLSKGPCGREEMLSIIEVLRRNLRLPPRAISEFINECVIALAHICT